MAAIRPILAAHGVDLTDDEILERFARHEAALESGPYQTVPSASWPDRWAAWPMSSGSEVTAEELATFSESVADWPAVPGLGRRPAPAGRSVSAGRDHQLRRRPVRGLRRAAGGAVRMGGHRRAGAGLQAEHRAVPRWP